MNLIRRMKEKKKNQNEKKRVESHNINLLKLSLLCLNKLIHCFLLNEYFSFQQ